MIVPIRAPNENSAQQNGFSRKIPDFWVLIRLEFNFGAVKIGVQATSPLFEIARVFVPLDHVAR
jgi:hypothetical protein